MTVMHSVHSRILSSHAYLLAAGAGAGAVGVTEGGGGLAGGPGRAGAVGLGGGAAADELLLTVGSCCGE